MKKTSRNSKKTLEVRVRTLEKQIKRLDMDVTKAGTIIAKAAEEVMRNCHCRCGTICHGTKHEKGHAEEFKSLGSG
jgi:hypothetical protein